MNMVQLKLVWATQEVIKAMERQWKKQVNSAWYHRTATSVSLTLIESVKQNFREGGRYLTAPAGEYKGGSAKWKPSYRATVTGGLTLVQSGRLMNSIHARISEGGRSVTLYSTDPKAPVHHYGATIKAKGKALHFVLADGRHVSAKSVHIPARPFLVLQPRDMEHVKQILLEATVDAMQGRTVPIRVLK